MVGRFHRCAGMRHALARLLGGGVDGELGVSAFSVSVKRHVVVGAVDRRGRGHQQVLAPRGAWRRLHHVEGADDVGVDIGARVFQAVAHAGLGCEMNDRRRAGTRRQRRRTAPRSSSSASVTAKAGVLQQHGVPAVLERRRRSSPSFRHSRGPGTPRPAKEAAPGGSR